MDMSRLGQRFRLNLQAAMASKGLTQKELADAMEIHFTVVNKYVLGKITPGLDVLERFATALQIEPIELLGEPVANHQDSR
jgi:transcriptional regulator with XRE-family HTH domain